MPLLDAATLARIASLELRARNIVEGHFSGRHASSSRGFSVEFSQHRAYVPGDDLRYLDWRLQAKRDRYYLKEFESEGTFGAVLVLDASRSMDYQSPDAPWSKFRCAQTLAAALAVVLLRQRDPVGLVVAEKEFDYLPPLSRPAQQRILFNKLEGSVPSAAVGPEELLEQLSRRLRRPHLMLLFSDVLDEPAPLIKSIRRLRHDRHDVRIVQILDPAELDFPFDEPSRFTDLEAGKVLNADAGAVAAAYREEIRTHIAAVRSQCHRAGGMHHLVSTTTAPHRVLAEILQRPGRIGA